MKEKKEKQISQEAQEKINYIGKLINEAKDGVISFNDDLANKFRVIALSVDDDDNDEEPLMYREKIEPLEDLCDELEIEVPFTCDVFSRVDYSYGVEYDGDILFINTDIELVISFLQGWVLSCANSVIQQAQERIGNLLETDC